MNRGARFLQSAGDFPCMVELGGKVPSWGLARWGRDRLGFKPLEDGGYTLRGNSRYVQYRGEKRSHRFTLLDGERFEYDCILNKEPDSNTISIFIDGWGNFDFLRQPDTTGPEILRGSYAVYKKECVVNSRKYHVGTGKICHIHRPKIIDSRGREVWGELSIDKGVMAITIPEKWLGEAKYPVTVDPVFGTSTIGAYYQYQYLSVEGYDAYLYYINDGSEEDINDWIEMMEIEISQWMALNKITPHIPLSGTVTTRVYTEKSENRKYSSGAYIWEDKGCPVIYSNYANQPKTYLFDSLNYVDCRVDATRPKGWRTTTMRLRSPIAANTDVWFGFTGNEGFSVRFDYGGQFCSRNTEIGYSWDSSQYSVYEELESCDMLDISGGWPHYLFDPSDPECNGLPGARFDFKVSQYLEIPGENYTRTLTQGVKLGDSRKLTGAYRRSVTQTARGTAGAAGPTGFYRKCVMDAGNTVFLKREPVFIRAVVEQIRAAMSIGNSRGIRRGIENNVSADSGTTFKQGFFRNVINMINTNDSIKFPVFLNRFVHDLLNITDVTGHWGEYLRGLYADAGSIAETTHKGEYYRKQEDTAYSEAVSLRHLFIFIRLLTTALIRDYIIGRFLKSREEIVIKSPVCREITLDSKLH